jgi:alpha-glucosidase
MRFWLECGVDGFRLDTVNYYFHDRWLRDNPPLDEAAAGTITATNPYLYQSHLFDKTQAENLDFLKRFRALLDEYEARASVGEVGDEGRSLQTLAAYTGGGDKLHMCYTFDLLGPQFSAAHVRGCVEAFEKNVADGWVCWAFSNHDVVRHVSRWARPDEDTDAVAKFAITLLASLRGSICLYQGEELGLTEAEIAFEDLRDPYGIRFWPGFKGRDGCRTPFPWEVEKPNAGFSTGKPWLPIPEEHRTRAADVQWGEPNSVLSRYRAVLALRKRHASLARGSIVFIDGQEDVLAFFREANAERLICVFNFAQEERRWILPPGTLIFDEIEFPERNARLDGLAIKLQPLGCFLGRVL